MTFESHFCPYGESEGQCNWQKIPGRVRDEVDIGLLSCSKCQVTKHEFDLRHKINYESGTMHSWAGGYGEEFHGPSLDKDRRVKAINDLVDHNLINSILDFGCGNGEMLEVLRSTFEIEIMGLEPENVARTQAQKRGFNVLSSISEFVKNSQKFDLITLFHVVEHLYEPLDILNELKKILNAGGILAIETPNSQDALISLYECDSFRNFTYWSHHPYLYSNKSLEILLNSAGFEMLFNTGVQRYSLDNHLYWLSKNKPGGHNVWGNLFDFEVLKAYNENLIQNRVQDTIWIVARMR